MALQAGVLTFTVEPSSKISASQVNVIPFTAVWTVDPEQILSPPYQWNYIQFILLVGGVETIVGGAGPLGIPEQPITRNVTLPIAGAYEVFCRLIPSVGDTSESNHVLIEVPPHTESNVH